MSNKTTYSEANIQALDWNENIRERAGMYIGSVDAKGFMELIRGLLSQTFLNAKPNYFHFELKEKSSGKIIFKNIQGGLKDSWATEHVDLNSPFWMEALVLNALSSEFNIKFFDKKGNQLVEQKFEKGKLKKGEVENKKLDCNSVEVDFKLDEGIWKADFEWNTNYIFHQIKDFAYLYKRVKFEIKYKLNEEPCLIIYHFKNGLKDKIDIERLNGLCQSYFMTYLEEKLNDFCLELAFAFRDNSVDAGFLKSYVNDHHTHQGGTHHKGLIKGLRMALKKYVKEKQLDQKYSFSKNKITSHLIAALNLKLDAPVFEGCTKNMLGSLEVSNNFYEQLKANNELAKKLLWKFEV
jgi:DNA gyrase/topoisomerase IV subunit B